MQMTLKDAFAHAFDAERRGDASAARRIYDDVLAAIPEHPGALLGIARQARAGRDYAAARDALDRAIASAKTMALPAEELWVERALVESAAGDRAAARNACAEALRVQPASVPALVCAGDLALADDDYSAAEARFRAALAQRDERAAPWSGLAQALAGLRCFADARAAIDRALLLAPRDPAIRAGAAWVALRAGDIAVAEEHCRAGLTAAPADAILARLLGQVRKHAGRYGEARATLEAIVARDPGDAAARNSLASVLLDLAQFDAAREHLEMLVASGAADGETFANLGIAFQQAGDYEAAAVWFARAVDASPALTPALADLVHARQYLCSWDGLDALEARLAATIDDPRADPRLSPFIALSLHFSPAQQLAAARRWSGATLPPVAAPAVVATRGDRLRVGYLSSDFRDHPTGRLMVGLIEAHDRQRVEVFGYGYGRGADSRLRHRIVAAFDQWRDLGGAGDADIAAAIRADRIDVLIDRKGHTHGGRLAALAERPAAVQLHYMSFPATLGYDAIDGLIADAIVAPPADDACYHERVFRLPRCYFVTDSARALPDRAARGDHGLPDDAIVLACLNQAYKLTPAMFVIWMDALRAAPRAVLWLLATHPRAQANLRAEASRRGVAAHRLVFAPAVDEDAHIARLRSADLALDTLPYGSHTTGVDALWGGVPMLTCRGATFAGRVGASLLAAVDLNELVTEDAGAYREQLVELATHPDRLREYAAHLERGRKTFPLFDTRGFAGDFERLLADAYGKITAARGARELTANDRAIPDSAA